MIHVYEFVHELAWNVIKGFFEYQGNTLIMGPREATREAFKRNLISDGEGWMDMLVSRNKSSHTYNEETATEIADKVLTLYFGLFQEFEATMWGLLDEHR